MVENALVTENLTRKLESENEIFLVRDVSIEIKKGEFVAICGPSGSGKSSLLYLLGLLDVPTAGKIFFNDSNVLNLDDNEKAHFRLKNIGFVFQFHFLLQEFSLLENVMLPMKKLGNLSEEQMRDRAMSLLESFGLGTEVKKVPKQISGGQSQRVAIARALANSPKIILADEPTGNLDSKSSENVQKILREVSKSTNCSVVTVTHDKDFALFADRIINVVDGKVK